MSSNVVELHPGPVEAVEQLLTVDDLATVLQKTRKSIYYLRDTGVLPPAVKVGQSLRWRSSAINAWLAELEEKNA
ncbi:helix-turn-helix domain-containing protein [Gordonia sp. HY285]|uniref:helix-turn-helix transcriptional regulator n=1 Tax=Gordonia liuliyuniae TaxID=2911517 RepID=UPI001F2B204B|nr:helix-turn-helix domain-containing protein [Gordonia liuliyuniae]MCF8610001.1 helix-turn-helix domain-containing protein [Gordonia liuliyuniae]